MAGPSVVAEYAAGKIRAGITGLEERIYTLAVGISDNVGNCSTLADPGFRFGVDMQAPGDPGRPQVVGLSHAGSIASSAPVFEWAHATDAKDGVAQSGVDLYELELRRAEDSAWGGLRFLIDIPGEDVDLEGLDTPLEGVFRWPLAQLALADGEHRARVRARDAAGNWSGWAECDTFEVDTTPPAVPGTPTTPSPTNHASPAWTWAPAGADAASYNVYLDGTFAANVARNSYVTEELREGTHSLQVTATDVLGNESARSALGYVVIDLTCPDVPKMMALPAFTSATQVAFSWSRVGDADGYDLRYSIDGHTWTTLAGIAAQSCIVPIEEAIDGMVVVGMVRARDAAGNTSEWSEPVETCVDRTGPSATITSPDEAVTTNLPGFTWTWSGSDTGAGVRGYWVRLNDEAWSWTTQSSFTSSYLGRGANVLHVRGVDNIGNEGAEAVAADVTLADVLIYDIMPAPGAHAINEVSTIAFSVVGLRDGELDVFVGGRPIEPWRVVTVTNTPELAKFYILLDASVVRPGPMTVTIRIGGVVRFCDYRVLSERTGFGFGRLRPW